MFRMKRVVLVALLIFGLVVPAGAAGNHWLTDFAAAKAQAKKEKKFLFIDFTGSDWCGWCSKLDKEVFSQEAFQKKITDKFVLVQLDFPKQAKQDEKTARQNKELSQKFNVRGFPTIILADADGEEFARTGYRAGGAEAYLATLDSYVKNFEDYQKLVQEAEKLQGVEKARKLDEAVSKLVANGSRRDFNQLSQQIIALDKDGKAGLKAKYELPKKLDSIRAELNHSRDFDKALKDLDKLTVEAKAVPPMLQQVYLFQAGILIKGKGDKAAGVKKLELAQNAAPDTQTGKNLAKFIAKMKADDAKAKVPAASKK